MNRFLKTNILFLDDDLKKSSEYLTNIYLENNIKNCYQILMCALYYFFGIRNKRIHKYYFSKEHCKDTLEKWFDTYPFKKAPNFTKYNSPEAKWIRKCRNHYEYVLEYFECMIEEYSFRFGRDNQLADAVDFFKYILCENSVKHGIYVPSIDNLKIVLPWKSLPLRYRKKNIILGYREYYKNIVLDPIMDYCGSKRNTPEWMIDKNEIFETV